MDSLKDGTYAIHDMQTGRYIPTPLGDCKPSEVDLREHEEIKVWLHGDWHNPPPELTANQKILADIRAYLDAAGELLIDLESEL